MDINIFIDVIIKKTPKMIFNTLWFIRWAIFTPSGAKKTVKGTKKKAIKYGKRVDKIGKRATKEFKEKTGL